MIKPHRQLDDFHAWKAIEREPKRGKPREETNPSPNRKVACRDPSEKNCRACIYPCDENIWSHDLVEHDDETKEIIMSMTFFDEEYY